MTTSDAALLARAADGDEAAFSVLYLRHVGACRRRARRVLATTEWVDDVVQLVFLDVWRHARRFEAGASQASARGWLLALTHHKAVDVVRDQERHRARREHEDLLLEHRGLDPGPEEVAIKADSRARVRAAVGSMPVLDRETVSLCFLEELSQKEVAARLQLPLGTVKTRSRRGVMKLQQLVDRTLL
jgi:RNA polymerase sigma-70 factor (ECF subfamily)